MTKSSIHAAYKNLLDRGRLTKNPGQAALVDRLATLQTTLSGSTAPQNGVYIYGNVGTGKSRIADLFAATLPSSISKRRIHFHEFMMDIHMRLHKARSASTYSGDPLVQIGQEVRSESRVLCFDEFQVTDIADAMILKRLFGAVWSAGGVMVATSNRHPTNLYEKGLNRSLFLPFIDELQRRCEVWKMEGEQDYRMSDAAIEETKRQTVYFTDEGGFRQSLEAATGGVSMEGTEIPVMMNRVLSVEAARVGQRGSLVVHSTFEHLCQANRGTSDYHALCKAAGMIYLSGLRQFRADELDYVRRFITLIDLAYETRTRVVCLSSAPLFKVFGNIVPPVAEGVQKKLEDMSVKKGGGSSSSMMSTFFGDMEWSATGLQSASLASGGAGETDVRFAVGRTVSRLFEMGSQSYGLDD